MIFYNSILKNIKGNWDLGKSSSHDRNRNTEEVEDIITSIPPWIIRAGTTSIVVIVSIVIFMSAFISYPDMVFVDLKVSSTSPIGVVEAKQRGNISQLLKNEGSNVQRGQILAIMETSASPKDVENLYKALLEIRYNQLMFNKLPDLPSLKLNLGELESSFEGFQLRYLQFLAEVDDAYSNEGENKSDRQLNSIALGGTKMTNRIAYHDQGSAKATTILGDAFEGYRIGKLSATEYKKEQAIYVSNQLLSRKHQGILRFNRIHKSRKSQRMETEQNIQNIRDKFKPTLNNMIMQTEVWLNSFILRAPISGVLNYAQDFRGNETVNKGQEIFVISPEGNNFYGRMIIPQNDIGKVRVGQDVMIKVLGYPSERYGIVRGKVKYIANVAVNDTSFLGKISFAKTKGASVRNKIILRNGMRAKAEIITEHRFLLERLLNGLYLKY